MLICSTFNNNFFLKVAEQKKFKKKLDAICLSTSNILDIKQSLYFDLNFISKRKIKNLNFKYRKNNCATDVISFAFNDNKNFFSNLIGEIYISTEVCKQQSIEQGHNFLDHLSFLVVHGILHLLGFDHLTCNQWNKMLKLSMKVLNNCDRHL